MDEDRVSKGLADIIDFVKTQTDADRAIVVYEGLGCCHGFGQEKIIWEEADLSLKMLATLVEKGESVMMKDVAAEPEYAERTTAVLAGLGSVLFVPVKNEFNYTEGFCI